MIAGTAPVESSFRSCQRFPRRTRLKRDAIDAGNLQKPTDKGSPSKLQDVGFKRARTEDGLTVEEQMMRIFKADQRCVGWTAAEWAEKLECDPSMVKKTTTWKACMKERGSRRKVLEEHLK